MNRFAVVVATFGDLEWATLGGAAAESVPREADVEMIVRHEPHGTLASVRNGAANRATAEWLCFLDADDALAPGYLDAMRATLHHWNLWRPDDAQANPLLLVPAVSYDGTDGYIPSWGQPLIEVNCAVIGTLIPRQLFTFLGGFRELASLEDWDLTLRAVRAGARLVPVRDAVYRAQTRECSRNADQSSYWQLRREHEPHFPWEETSRYLAA